MKWLCLDTFVVVKLLIDEDQSDAASRLIWELCRLIAPAFLWAEVGSVLRKKVRQGLPESLANEAWEQFRSVPIE